MEIKIKKINTQILTGNASGVINTYMVIEDGKEFLPDPHVPHSWQ